MRHRNGEGSIYRRKDGRWAGAALVLTTSGIRKRVHVYAKSYTEARSKLDELMTHSRQHVPVANQRIKLDQYLDYWLENYVRPNLRPKTYEQYEMVVRLYLKPGLGDQYLEDLTVPRVQSFLNGLREQGRSVRRMQIVRTTLSGALTNAQREEYLVRNVARLVRLPEWVPAEVHPWTVDEAKRFLLAARSHRLYPAFLLLVLCGMRRGEVLGLRWQDLNFENNTLNIRQQLQRVGRQLITAPVKTKAGERALPLLPTVKEALIAYRQSEAQNPAINSVILARGLVFLTSEGTPIEPRNFVRSYWRICRAHNIRIIRLHHIRHTTATMLKDTGVPARDTQLILGHASPWTTTQIYQHDDLAMRRDHIQKLEVMLTQAPGDRPEGSTE